MPDRPIYPIARSHLVALGGPLGIWQHASGAIPNEAFGYCTDDVARALVVDVLHSRHLGWTAVEGSARRSLAFLSEAFHERTGSFRNFRNRAGNWLDDAGSEDSQGRAMRALGTVLEVAPEIAAVDAARALFLRALPATRRLTALRATSSALIGCDAALTAGSNGETEETFAYLASALREGFRASDRDAGWPWPEQILTYENALLPHALLVAGARLGDVHLLRAGLTALDWLIRVQTSPDGQFSPIGSGGWWPRGQARSRFDQQPIEAASMILAAEAAFRQTGERTYLRVVEMAYAWFLGDNDAGLPVADTARGGCHDGLTPSGVNLNQGAESTLMWLTALEHVRSLREATSSIFRRQGRRTAPVLVGARS